MTIDCSIGPGPDAPTTVHALIEIPRGSRNKYEVDPETGLIALNRFLHTTIPYPADYGFIPGTLAPDGDPLDVAVLVSEPTFPGCLIRARPIGALKMLDDGLGDDKIIAVPAGDPYSVEIQELADVTASHRLEVETFFRRYKLLEGKTVTTNGWVGRDEALDIIRAAIKETD